MIWNTIFSISSVYKHCLLRSAADFADFIDKNSNDLIQLNQINLFSVYIHSHLIVTLRNTIDLIHESFF